MSVFSHLIRMSEEQGMYHGPGDTVEYGKRRDAWVKFNRQSTAHVPAVRKGSDLMKLLKELQMKKLTRKIPECFDTKCQVCRTAPPTIAALQKCSTCLQQFCQPCITQWRAAAGSHPINCPYCRMAPFETQERAQFVMKCAHCKKEVQEKEIGEHTGVCEALYFTECPFECGVKPFANMDDVARHVRDHCPCVARHDENELSLVLLREDHPKKNDPKVQRIKDYIWEAPLPGDYEQVGLNDDGTPIKPKKNKIVSQKVKSQGQSKVVSDSMVHLRPPNREPEYDLGSEQEEEDAKELIRRARQVLDADTVNLNIDEGPQLIPYKQKNKYVAKNQKYFKDIEKQLGSMKIDKNLYAKAVKAHGKTFQFGPPEMSYRRKESSLIFKSWRENFQGEFNLKGQRDGRGILIDGTTLELAYYSNGKRDGQCIQIELAGESKNVVKSVKHFKQGVEHGMQTYYLAKQKKLYICEKGRQTEYQRTSYFPESTQTWTYYFDKPEEVASKFAVTRLSDGQTKTKYYDKQNEIIRTEVTEKDHLQVKPDLFIMGSPLLKIQVNLDDFDKKYNIKKGAVGLKCRETINELTKIGVMGFEGTELIAAQAAQSLLESGGTGVHYFGCVGKDEEGDKLEQLMLKAGIKPILHRATKSHTGCVVTNHNEYVACNQSTSPKYPTDVLDEHLQYLQHAKFVYTTAFFASANPQVFTKLTRFCRDHDKRLVFDVADSHFVDTNFAGVKDAIEFCSIIFFSGEEGTALARQFEVEGGLIAIAKKIQTYRQHPQKAPRVVVVTNGAEPVILVTEAGVTHIPVPYLAEEKIKEQNFATEVLIGGFLACMAREYSLEDSIVEGITMAQRAVQGLSLKKTKESKIIERDILVIGNPLLDISIPTTDDKLIKKYGLTEGSACLAEPKHMPIYAEIESMKGSFMSPGGAGLNSARGAAYALRRAGHHSTKGIAYFGCIGQDKHGETLREQIESEGITPVLHMDRETPTGTCAALISGKDRTLCASIAASCKYPSEHLEEHMAEVEGANIVYATGYFLTSNAQALRKIGRFCCANNKVFAFNLAAAFLLFTNYDDVMDCIKYADYVFCNEDEGKEMAKKQNLDPENPALVAKFLATYPKANSARQRKVIITQGSKPIVIATQRKDKPPVVDLFPVPLVPQQDVVDVNGAGDALVGGFLSGLVRKMTFDEALFEGVKLSQLIITRQGVVFEKNKKALTSTTDIFIVANPHLSMKLHVEDDRLIQKYQLSQGNECLAGNQQSAVFDELEGIDGSEFSAAGPGVVEALAVRAALDESDCKGKGVTVVGSVGQDERGKMLQTKLAAANINAVFHPHRFLPTSTYAILEESGGIQSRCEKLAASSEYPIDHVDANIDALLQAQVVYLTGSFLLMNQQGCHTVGQLCAKVNKPAVIYIDDPTTVQKHYEGLLEVIKYADYVFLTEEVSSEFALKLGFDIDDPQAVSRFVASFIKDNLKRKRICLILRQFKSIILAESAGNRMYAEVSEVPVPVDEETYSEPRLIGGFLAGLVRNLPVKKALEAGITLAQTQEEDRSKTQDFGSDLLVLGNPLLEQSVKVYHKDEWDKYKDRVAIESEKDRKISPGGAGLNTARGVRFALKENECTTNGVIYLGCVGNDEHGKLLEQHMKAEDITPIFYKDKVAPTSTSAILIKGKERKVQTNVAASTKYPMSHLESNMSAVKSARIVYATGHFLTSNTPALKKIARVCAEQNKVFAFKVASTDYINNNHEDLLDIIKHSDYLFINEEQSNTFAEKQGIERGDAHSVAKYLASLPKANNLRQRIVFITRGPHSIVVGSCSRKGDPDYAQVPVPMMQAKDIVNTDGCGDSFAAGFLYATIRGWNIRQAMFEGIWLAQLVASRHGVQFEEDENAFKLDIFVIGNPLLDISVYAQDRKLLDKYGLEYSKACLATKEQMPIFDELSNMKDCKFSIGGAGLNAASAARFRLKEVGYETNGVTYFGSIGTDERGAILKKHLKAGGLLPMLHKDLELSTGASAAVVVDGERTLCADIAASVKYPQDHLERNLKYLEAAEIVYLTAYFLSSSVESMKAIGKYCAFHDKPFVFNLAACFLLHTNYDDVMFAIEHADFVFGNEDEASEFAVKQGLDKDDRLGAAKFIAQYKKANEQRPRFCIITQGPKPILIAWSWGKSAEVEHYEIKVPPVEKVVDTNGAGDSLVGGFLAGQIRNLNFKQSIEEGISMAQRIIQRYGCCHLDQ